MCLILKETGYLFVVFFIDGTVEGTNILKYATANDSFTYYGNGCPNTWDDSKPGHGGSSEACSTRIVSTFDGENQKNGTYFTFNAAASGSGGTSLATNNANSPDTFCPLGWQMPYGGTGGDYYDKSKSMNFLFDSYNLDSHTVSDRVNMLRSYPIVISPSGVMNFGVGRLFYQGVGNYYWTATNATDTSAYWFVSARVEATGKTTATPIRCI